MNMSSVKTTTCCASLGDLPEPPPGKTGWPWTEESRRLARDAREEQSWTRVSVITPSFNQGQFIEETIRSILLQGYPNLEYIIFDGGSTDETVEIIEKYAPWLTYWVSEKDKGQSDAINKGLRMATGEFATWINSDDLLAKNALVEHASRIGFSSTAVYVGDCFYIDENSTVASLYRGTVQTLEDLVRIPTVWNACRHIVQPEVLFPRKLALAVGGVNPDNHFTMDYELWGRLFLAGAEFKYTGIPFGMFREHAQQKTHNPLRITESLLESAAKLIRLSDSIPEDTKKVLLDELDAYRVQYHTRYWRGTGRLAKIGLPPGVVNWLRSCKAIFQQA